MAIERTETDIREARAALWRIARGGLVRQEVALQTRVADLKNDLRAAESDLTQCKHNLARFDADYPAVSTRVVRFRA